MKLPGKVALNVHVSTAEAAHVRALATLQSMSLTMALRTLIRADMAKRKRRGSR